MATKVHMEALSPTMEEGQVVRWLKAEGDTVASGDILAEIETDKATMELVARGDGILRKILLGDGGTAPVGDVIGVIAEADEDIGDLAGPDGPESESAGAAADHGTAVESAPVATESAVATASAPTPEPPPVATAASGGRIKASPVAKKLAAERGVDLATIAGSGPGGRIVKKDVEAAGAGGAPAAVSVSGPAAVSVSGPTAAPTIVAAGDEPEYTDHPLSQMRKTIAKRLVESIGPVPHFFLTIDVDMARAMEARKSINGMLEAEGRKISLNDMIIRATAAALRKHPECNAHWGGDHIRRFSGVHIGVAVAVEDGLITPIVRNAHLKGMAHIAAEVREMAGRAREKRLKPEEYTGATFSISNLGMFGIHEFTAVINPPEAGILAVGGVVDTPVAVDGQVVVRPRMRITMSCDHRVIDGAQGSRFLATLKTMLEEPTAILV
jgi:pyruvate dehydrogenase E2 component (dihydrolipoyllysine-residue acetyltransferase)